MLGGTCTLIGTSTNLVVAGFQQNRYPNDPALSNMGIFDIAPYGLIYASWCVWLVIVLAYASPCVSCIIDLQAHFFHAEFSAA